MNEALAAEAAAFFGPDVEPAQDEEGAFAILATAGRGRFSLPLLTELFGEGAVQPGDELLLQLYWQPHEAGQRAAQRGQYGALLDYDGFAARTERLYRAWKFVSAHFPFPTAVCDEVSVVAAKLAGERLELQLKNSAGPSGTLALELSAFDTEPERNDCGRPLRARLEALGLVRAPSSPAEWFGLFRQEFLSLAREAVFLTDHAAEGRVSVEVPVDQAGLGFFSDRHRFLLLLRDARGELKSIGCSPDRPVMPGALQQQLAGTQVVIAPFAWSACRVRVVGGAPPGAAFAAWFERWFNPPRAPDEKTFCAAIHSVSQPVPAEPAGWEFVVNFGSAPPAAASELVGLLAPGAALVALGLEPGELKLTT